MKSKKALLIVDLQNDFCPGGALAVPQGDEVVPVLNKYISIFSRNELPIFASRDWHSTKTRHFKKFGGSWPVHCVQNTPGAEFHPKLKLPKKTIFLYKGMDPAKDSYSVFQARDAAGRSFLNLLRLYGIEEIYLGGLATDYCVKFSGLDALKQKFRVKILIDAIRGVNLKSQDSKKAIQELVRQGARKIKLNQLKLGVKG